MSGVLLYLQMIFGNIMTTEELELAIVDNIKAKITNMYIGVYPESIDEDYEVMHEIGEILVRWNGIQEVSRSISQQGLSDEFEIVVLNRSLRGGTGMYKTIADIRDVINKTFVCGQSLYFISAQYIAYYLNNNIWHYTIRCIMPSVEYI